MDIEYELIVIYLDLKNERTVLEMKKAAKYIALVLVCAIVSVGGGYGGSILASKNIGPATIFNGGSSSNESLAQATGSKLSVQEIIEKNADSVVEIRTESVVTDNWMQQYVTEGAGSGVIVDSKGYIVTNNHVIDGARKINVKLHNGDSYSARLISTDPMTDVAVIKISAEKLTPATYGNSDELTVGDLAVAIGNPLGQLGGTATCGIISALDRELNIDGTSMRLLQTDASINPGNSGGGLFDQYGNLIGIVVAKSSGSDVEGLGFAIPVNKVKEIADQLIEGGKVAGRAAIGIQIYYVDLSQAMEQGYMYPGLYIAEVASKNAKQAGIKEGDYIYYFDGERIETNEDLQNQLSKHKVGDKVKMVVVRDGKTVDCEVILSDSSEL